MTTRHFSSFAEFYPYYQGEHTNRTCRRLHFVGSTGTLICLLLMFAQRNPLWLLAAVFCGYGFAWIGHFVFQKNKPATFTHPIYSLMGDWRMYWEIWTGKVPL